MRRVAAACFVLALGCSKAEQKPERTEPWPAARVEESRPAAVTRFALTNESAGHVDVSTRKQKNVGDLPVVKGRLEIDLADLARSRGTVSADVAAIRMRSFEDAAANREQTQRAQSWLDVGASRPEAHREKHRWATFTIREIENLSAMGAHQGAKRSPPRRVAVTDAGDAAADSPLEIRRVSFDAVGDLLLHGFRVEARARLVADFGYDDGVSFDAIPKRIEIRTRGPLRVSLVAHDIKPRDTLGVVVADQLPLLKTHVRREARVGLNLVAVPAEE